MALVPENVHCSDPLGKVRASGYMLVERCWSCLKLLSRQLPNMSHKDLSSEWDWWAWGNVPCRLEFVFRFLMSLWNWDLPLPFTRELTSSPKYSLTDLVSTQFEFFLRTLNGIKGLDTLRSVMSKLEPRVMKPAPAARHGGLRWLKADHPTNGSRDSSFQPVFFFFRWLFEGPTITAHNIGIS